MKAGIKQHLIRIAVILAGSAIIGTLLLILVFCIPTKAMKRNVARSLGDMIKSEEQVPDNAFSRYIWANKETYTGDRDDLLAEGYSPCGTCKP